VRNAISAIRRGPKGDAGIFAGSYAARVLHPHFTHATSWQRHSVVCGLIGQLRLLVPTRAGVGHLGKLARAALAVRRVQVDHLVDLLRRKKRTLRTPVPRLPATLAAALLVLLLARTCPRWVGRRRHVRVARVATELLHQLGDLLRQHLHLRRQRRDLPLELRDARISLGNLGLQLGDASVFPPALRLQLRDSLVTPVRRHGALIAHPRPNGKCEKKDGAIWATYARPERLRFRPQATLRGRLLDQPTLQEFLVFLLALITQPER